MKDVTRINLKNNTYYELSKSKTAMRLKTFDSVVNYLIDNQRPINHQIELDAEREKAIRFRKQQEIHMQETQQAIQDMDTLCRYMKENGIRFEMSEEILSEFLPENRKTLEQTVIIPTPKRNMVNSLTPTITVPDIVNEDVE